MKSVTVSELITQLETSDPTAIVVLSLGDGSDDVSLCDVLNIPGQVLLCGQPQPDIISTVIQFFVGTISDSGDTPLFCVEYSMDTELYRVGPPSYDFLIVEAVVQELYENIGAFVSVIAHSSDAANEYVDSLFAKRGGT